MHVEVDEIDQNLFFPAKLQILGVNSRGRVPKTRYIELCDLEPLLLGSPTRKNIAKPYRGFPAHREMIIYSETKPEDFYGPVRILISLHGS